MQGAEPPAGAIFEMTAPDHSRKSGVALEKTYQFLLWLIPAVEKFPKSQKFLLGDRMQTLALDVQESLIEATYSKNPAPHLLACKGLKRDRPRFPVGKAVVKPRRIEVGAIGPGGNAQIEAYLAEVRRVRQRCVDAGIACRLDRRAIDDAASAVHERDGEAVWRQHGHGLDTPRRARHRFWSYSSG